jgi:hypothetical protein
VLVLGETGIGKELVAREDWSNHLQSLDFAILLGAYLVKSSAGTDWSDPSNNAW